VRSAHRAFLGLAVLAAAACSSGDPREGIPPAGAFDTPSVDYVDERLRELIRADTRVEKIADGFTWLEGPAWDPREEALLFSDIPANAIHQWSEGEGTSLFLTPSGYTGSEAFEGREPGSNGLLFDAAGRLVVCQHGDRRIARMQAGELESLVEAYQGRRLNSPNDAVYDRGGALYFTDPPFGLPETFEDPARELPFSGVYRLAPNGELDLMLDTLVAPNGISLSPDERTLYITDVDPERPAWLTYQIEPDGSLSSGRVLRSAQDWMATEPGGPDGLVADRLGNLYAAGPGGVYVMTAEGEHLGTIRLGVATANVTWGEDGRTLFIAAGKAIYRVRTAVGGALRKAAP
jgi:gluconolactonase